LKCENWFGDGRCGHEKKTKTTKQKRTDYDVEGANEDADEIEAEEGGKRSLDEGEAEEEDSEKEEKEEKEEEDSEEEEEEEEEG
jgi:cell division protein FtsQ